MATKFNDKNFKITRKGEQSPKLGRGIPNPY